MHFVFKELLKGETGKEEPGAGEETMAQFPRLLKPNSSGV